MLNKIKVIITAVVLPLMLSGCTNKTTETLPQDKTLYVYYSAGANLYHYFSYKDGVHADATTFVPSKITYTYWNQAIDVNCDGKVFSYRGNISYIVR